MDRNMDALAKEERREYFRNWRKANKERVKQYNVEYWKKRAEKKIAEKRGVETCECVRRPK